MPLKFRHGLRKDTGNPLIVAVMQVTHYLERKTLVELLASSLLCRTQHGEHDTDASEPSQAELLDGARRTLRAYGQCGSEAAGDLYGLPDARWEWARRQADRLWPRKEA
jgi:hypothetical protein